VPVAKVGVIGVIHITTIFIFGYATWYTNKQREQNDNEGLKPGIVSLFKKYLKACRYGLAYWGWFVFTMHQPTLYYAGKNCRVFLRYGAGCM
jgi:hypothetical protein